MPTKNMRSPILAPDGVTFEGVLVVSHQQLREILNRTDISKLSSADLLEVLSKMDEFLRHLNAGVNILGAVAMDSIERAHRYAGQASGDISSRDTNPHKPRQVIPAGA